MTISIKKNIKALLKTLGVIAIALCAFQCINSNSAALKIKKGTHIILIGNNLGSRKPEGINETIRKQDFSDLLGYLSSLKKKN